MPVTVKINMQPWVFLPGFAQGEDTFADVIAYMDAPCYTHCWGGGSFDEELFRLEEFLRQVAANHDGLAPIVVGYSMGGRMALSLSVRCISTENATFERSNLPFAGLVLESAGLGPVDEQERHVLAVRNQEWADRLRQDGSEAFFTWWESLPLFASQKRLPTDLRNQIRQNRLSQDPELLTKQLVNLGAQHMPLQSRILGAMHKAAKSGFPILYICGALDKKYSRIAAQIHPPASPYLQVETVSDAGHNVHLEQLSAFCDLLQKFVFDYFPNALLRVE